MVDRLPGVTGDARGLERPPDRPGLVLQLWDRRRLERQTVVAGDEEPQPRGGDIAGHGRAVPEADREPPVDPPRRHALKRCRRAAVPLDAHDAGRRLEPKGPGFDPPQVAERDGQADRGVAAHVEVADAIEVEGPKVAGGVGRGHEHHAHHRLDAARVGHDRPPEVIEARAKRVAPLPHGTRPKRQGRGEGFVDHQPRRLADRVRVDHPHAGRKQVGKRGHERRGREGDGARSQYTAAARRLRCPARAAGRREPVGRGPPDHRAVAAPAPCPTGRDRGSGHPPHPRD